MAQRIFHIRNCVVCQTCTPLESRRERCYSFSKCTRICRLQGRLVGMVQWQQGTLNVNHRCSVYCTLLHVRTATFNKVEQGVSCFQSVLSLRYDDVVECMNLNKLLNIAVSIFSMFWEYMLNSAKSGDNCSQMLFIFPLFAVSGCVV